jgi:nucleotide-binding universal stress UspA family protein
MRRKEVPTMQRKQFLIATDGSPGAVAALRQAIALAREADAKLTIAYVRRAPLPVLGDPYYQRALSKELEVARAVVAEAARAAAAAGVEVTTEILEGHTADRIVELARTRGVDVIIVGSRGRGGVTGALLGSVSESIVHKADRPVLVVKPCASVARRAA